MPARNTVRDILGDSGSREMKRRRLNVENDHEIRRCHSKREGHAADVVVTGLQIE